jgi:alkylhydroperoxidase family enzyme
MTPERIAASAAAVVGLIGAVTGGLALPRTREQFTEGELVGLTVAVSAINGWNRIAIPFRAEVGSYPPGTAEAATAALASA